MEIVIKNQLTEYLDRLNRAKKDAPNFFAKIVAQKAVDIANEQYGNTPEVEGRASVKSDIDGNHIKITASGKNLIYTEYGIGEEGRASDYGGNLIFPIEFYSNVLHKNVSLKKWTYSYANELTKGNPNPYPTLKGHKAYAQMFNTGNELRKIYSKNVKENTNV